jgi:hypothetical protein
MHIISINWGRGGGWGGGGGGGAGAPPPPPPPQNTPVFLHLLRRYIYAVGLWTCVAVATEDDLSSCGDVNHSVDAPVLQERHCGYAWFTILPFDLIDSFQAFFKLFVTGDGDHAGGLFLDQETYCQPSTGGDAYPPVTGLDSAGT